MQIRESYLAIKQHTCGEDGDVKELVYSATTAKLFRSLREGEKLTWNRRIPQSTSGGVRGPGREAGPTRCAPGRAHIQRVKVSLGP